MGQVYYALHFLLFIIELDVFPNSRLRQFSLLSSYHHLGEIVDPAPLGPDKMMISLILI